MATGEVHDKESLMGWVRRGSDEVSQSNPTPSNDQIASLAYAISHLTEALTPKAMATVDSPYFTKEEAARYLRTTVDGIYGRIERGQLKRCPGVREYLFTREMLDDSMMGRVQTPPCRRAK